MTPLPELSRGPAPGRESLPRAADLPTMSLAVRPASVQDDLVTIGVVIDVPPPFGQELQLHRADFGDPMAHAIPAHITLLPPTEVAPGDGDTIAEHLGAVLARRRSFTMRLHGTDSFRPVSPVVFIVLEQGAADCDDLQRVIRTGPLERELSFDYHPHVTVAHHLDDAALDRAQTTLADYSCEFTVAGVELYEHGRSGWSLVRRFPFGQRP